MTYSQQPTGTGYETSDEVVHSPFVSAVRDDFEFDQAMMGAYEFEPGSGPARATVATRPLLRAPRVMQVPGGFVPPGYKLVPLSGNGEAGMSTAKKIAIFVAVVLVAGAIIYYVKQRKGKTAPAALTPAQAVKKMPTSRLARNLYARLAKNGKASRDVLVALDEIAEE